MSELTPITREETYLNAISEGGESGLSPITREEMYLSAIAGESDLPNDMAPITRREHFLQKILDNGTGGGGEAEGTVQINITENGTITRNVARYASAEITTNVPNPSTGTKEITQNGDHDVTDFATAHVAVPQPSGSVNINSNGTHDVTNYASANVNVPNSYSASDEGKVVSNGALVSQTSRQITQNGTVDTTLNDEVVVNVPTGITPSGSQTFTQNGTYDVTNIAEAVVNVASGGSGAQILASGTFVGDGTSYSNVFVGTQMPQTDFIYNIWLDNGTQVTPTSSGDRMIVWAQVIIQKKFVAYDLSSNGTKSRTAKMTYPTDNGSGSYIDRKPIVSTLAGFARMTIVESGSLACDVIRDSTGFTAKVYASSNQYKFENGLTFNWELIYIGSDPENDIVEVA